MYYFYLIPACLCFFTSVYGYRRFRKLPVRVVCWFCGNSTKVHRGNKNCWDCPHCEQYNGFKENGDYNKQIPAQYDESLNFPITAVRKNKKVQSSNGLCCQCNIHEAVKVKLLSSFIPLNQSNFDNEVDYYKHHLEKVYPLCQHCALYVQRRLQFIDEKLLMDLPHSCYVSNLSVPSKEEPIKKSWLVFLPLLAHLSSILCLSLLLPATVEQFPWKSSHLMTWLPSSQLLVVIGFLLSLCAAVFTERVQWYLTDAFEILLWILVQLSFSSVFVNRDPFLDATKPVLLTVSIFMSTVNILNRHSSIFVPRKTRSKWLRKRMFRRTDINRQKWQPETDADARNGELLRGIRSDKFRCKTNRYLSTEEILPKTLHNIHITPPDQTINSGTMENSLKRKMSNFLVPPRFVSQPITKASWVAGGFWSASANYSKKTSAQFVSSAFLTPPPSANGSQASQACSQAGSLYSEDWCCGTKTCGSTVSSYTCSSSTADKGSNTDLEKLCISESNGKGKCKSFFALSIVGLSFMANAVFVMYGVKN